MKINFSILSLVWMLFICKGFPQEIKLPEERIMGKDIRIEKTKIFPFSFPSFKIILPELLEPYETQTNDGMSFTGKTIRQGNIIFAIGSNNSFQNGIFYHSIKDGKAEYSLGLENLFSDGDRDNSQKTQIGTSFQRNSADSRFSFGLTDGTMELPGPEGSPFLDEHRDFFSFHTDYSFTKDPAIIPSVSQRFYSIDKVGDINFTLIELFVDRGPFTLETGIERQDVFDDDFSSTGFYQSGWLKQGGLNIGGTLKIIERHGVRFLPSLIYNINENITMNITGIYRIPDLYSSIISDNYKELVHHNITPEEEYKASLTFHKKIIDTDIYLDISPSYRDNFYGWADIDNNGLFEPYPQQYWQTSVNLELQHKLTNYLRWYLKGEKRFLSEDIEYYPEEVFDTGFVVNYKNLSLNTWLSYTGERKFLDRELENTSVINTEVIFRKDKVEWGIAVYNITDREYFIAPGYPAEERSIRSFIKVFF
ncbi:MAG: hypothetical protein PHI44_03240 [Candidatus Ratteibacteria bacterium]|nr:hypothetical protein [Candidatus Ratteibacteria bacterium]